MSWNEKDNPWMKRQTKRVRMVTLSVVVMGVISVGYAILMSSIGLRVLNSGGVMQFGWPWVFGIGFILYFIGMDGFVLRVFLRERRIRKLVPAHEGRVCPKCIRMMEEIESESCQCARCKCVWSDPDLTRYWEQFVLARKESAQWLVEERLSHQVRKIGVRQRIIPFAVAHPAIWNGVSFAVFASGYVGWSIYVQTHWTQVLFKFLMFGPMFLGATLVGLGMNRRRGHESRCAVCDYSKSPTQKRDDDTKCPECGAFWNAPGGTIHGTLSKRPGLMYTGVACMALFFVVTFARFSPLASFAARVVPNTVIVQQLGANLHAGNAMWAELGNRQLEADEVNTLANLLMDRRLEVTYFTVTKASTWLDAQAAAGTLSPDAKSRYYAQMVVPEITMFENAKPHDELQFALGGNMNVSSAFEGKFVIDGFYVDGQSVAHKRGERWRSPLDIDTSFVEHREKETLPIFRTTFDGPGRHVVNAVVWVVLLPPNSNLTQDPWDADGKIIIPANAIWSKRYDIVYHIDVEQ